MIGAGEAVVKGSGLATGAAVPAGVIEPRGMAMPHCLQNFAVGLLENPHF
jgi:hypothetical protein